MDICVMEKVANVCLILIDFWCLEIAVVEKKLLNGDIKIVYRCCFCFNKQVRTSEQHKHIRKIHFPDWQTESDVKVQYEAAIKSMKE